MGKKCNFIKRRWNLFVLLLIANSCVGFASTPDDGDNLYVYTKGAIQAVTYSLDNLDKITFGDNEVSLWTNSGKTDYAYSQIELLTFRSGIKPATNVKSPTVSNGHVRWMYDRSLQTVSMMSEKGLSSVTVVDAQGRVVIKEHATGKECQLSLEHIPSGVYVLKVSAPRGNDTTIKIIK